MSTVLSQETSRTRKTVSRHLSTGHNVELSPQESRMLKQAYDYLAGFAKRFQIEAAIQKQRDIIAGVMPPPVRLNSLTINSNTISKNDSDVSTDRAEKVSADEITRARNDLVMLEEHLKKFNSIDQKISIKDLDCVTRKIGTAMHRKHLEQMIWEVDENSDGFVDWDEFQLTYFRNITDVSGNEPCGLFEVLEFLCFDSTHKGFITEDDCMEILFERYGSHRLEKELQALFGQDFRSSTGSGTLALEAYLSRRLMRTGRRALINSY